MSRRLPPLNALKAFEAAARQLSFTKAADELFVTQAAVSHQIKALEEFLGMKLFMRKNRSLLLTEEGQSYFLDVKDVFSSLTEATDKLLARGAKGAITVSLTPSFAIQWLVPRLSRFSELYPDIDVRIKAVDQDDNSLTQDVDIAIYYGRGNWPDVRIDKLRTEYLLPLCSPMLLTNPNKPMNSPEDLKLHTLLHDMTRKDWKNWFKSLNMNDINVNKGPIFSHSSMVLQAAVHGQGVALVHHTLSKPEIDAGRLVSPFSHALADKSAFYLVSRESQAELGKIVSFREWMLQMFKEEETLFEEEIGV